MLAEHPVLPSEAQSPDCRLCGGETRFRFRATIMRKYEIAYFRCDGCASMQTEHPFWIDEAYDLHLGHMDCGAVQRNISNAATCLLVSKLWGLRDALDYGGGDGLLTRFVRDYGINCFVWDKYATPTYAQGFSEPTFAQPELIFSFEVFEHFPDPRAQVEELFRKTPKIMLISTGIYREQTAQWHYLSLGSGRHVFFYSAQAMRQIAEKYGYEAVVSGDYTLFMRKDVASAPKAALFRLLSRKPLGRLLRCLPPLMPARGVNRDVALLKSRQLSRPDI